MTKKPALGRGLSALLQDDKTDITQKEATESSAKTAGSVAEIEISKIEANPFQPRTKFEEEALEELAQSIKELGIIQPVTVRKLGYDTYQLISGERRFRASQMAGLDRIPAYVRIANDQSMLEMALVENIQRANLDAIEVAISYQRLIDECKLTQEELSQRVGKKRSTISNYLRLLKLPADIQEGIRDGKISMGHARALINIENPEDQLAVFEQILNETLSVRKTEELAKNKKEEKPKKHPSSVMPLSLLDKKIKANLSEHFKVNVKFQRKEEDKGRIVIPFSSEDELDKILKAMKL
ncbi:MAG: chromosome partitioning protein ParB [Flavobacteriales bacterium]|nr:chromosome partitioning protein ParB [Flavobacteriales bacterium]|tara:strand:+ start:21124 stop:22014 length:891 start_codon:yes stop_codon:yes gene_type:complete